MERDTCDRLEREWRIERRIYIYIGVKGSSSAGVMPSSPDIRVFRATRPPSPQTSGFWGGIAGVEVIWWVIVPGCTCSLLCVIYFPPSPPCFSPPLPAFPLPSLIPPSLRTKR